MSFVVRCRYIANGGEPEGVGYLDNEARCSRDVRDAKTFDAEADAWAFAGVSGERVPEDCWVEEVMSDVNITKGSHIRAAWFKAQMDPPACLAGMQLKFGATKFEVVGVVKHVRGDHPTNPTVIRFYVDPDHPWDGPTVTPEGCTCGHPHVEIDPKHIVGVET